MSLSKIVCLSFLLFGTVSLMTNAELVGYWSFDKADETNDLTGNGNDGVIHGNPKVVAGKFGEALEFNGSTDYVEIPDAPAISELEALSMSAWIQPLKLGAWVAVAEKGIHLNWSYGFFSSSLTGHSLLKFPPVPETIWSVVSVTLKWKLENGITSSVPTTANP